MIVNTLERKVAVDFFNFPPKSFSNWDEIFYWLRSSYVKQKIPIEWLKEYNNMIFQPGETIKPFNLRFT